MSESIDKAAEAEALMQLSRRWSELVVSGEPESAHVADSGEMAYLIRLGAA